MSTLPARPEIADSWRRAAMFGVDPRGARPLPAREVDQSSRMLSVSRPLIDALHRKLADQPLCLMLADDRCNVVGVWTGHRRLRDKLEDRGVAVGVSLDEGAAGTNGLGTPFETGREISISGSEHYLEALADFSCVGLPIRHPLTRHTLGVLDATVEGSALNPLLRPLLHGVIRDIEDSMIDSARDGDRRIFRAFQNATRRRSLPVAAVGGDLLLANKGCLERIGAVGPDVLRLLLGKVPASGRATLELELGDAGSITVEAERIDGTRDGALFYLGSVTNVSPASDINPPHAPEVRRNLLIAGEPGSGRTARALEEVDRAAYAVLHATEAMTTPERAWAAQLVGQSASSVSALIVEDVHLLSENLSTVLRRVMASPAAPRVVLTACPLPELPAPARGLAGACIDRIALPPLRDRIHELPAVIEQLVRAQGLRPLHLTGAAMESLAAHPWPGNLTQLARVVEELSSRPHPRPIGPLDLPPEYQVTARARGLGGREKAERIAIINALRTSGGNKCRAAECLGVSRTTLYRRMQALGVAAVATAAGG